MKTLLALCLALAACSHPTAPDLPASVTFRILCPVPQLYNLIVDQAVISAQRMTAGDSAQFPVSPGQHQFGAIGGDFPFPVWWPAVVELEPGQRYTQTLDCR